MIGGVAAGLADYAGVDVVVVRVALVVLAVMGGLGVPLYLVAWLMVPESGSDASVADEILGRVRHQGHQGYQSATTWATVPAPPAPTPTPNGATTSPAPTPGNPAPTAPGSDDVVAS